MLDVRFWLDVERCFFVLAIGCEIFESLKIKIISRVKETTIGEPFKYVNLLPFVVMLFDFLENISIVTLLKTFPDTSEMVLFLCEIFKMGIDFRWAECLFFVVWIIDISLQKRLKQHRKLPLKTSYTA
jgi:hypothetical protein